jgi:hypothetical protein
VRHPLGYQSSFIFSFRIGQVIQLLSCAKELYPPLYLHRYRIFILLIINFKGIRNVFVKFEKFFLEKRIVRVKKPYFGTRNNIFCGVSDK